MRANMVSSYSAAGQGWPTKLLQSRDAIDVNGCIVPLHLQIYPTNACNLSCSFCSCSARNRELELSLSDTRAILNEFFSLGTRALTISGGGEPLLLPHINELIDLAGDLDMDIGLVTNGTLMSKLKVAVDPMWIRVSTSDTRTMDGDFWNDLRLAVEQYPTTDWAFSHVLTREPDYAKLRMVLGFAQRHNFSHVRIVSDLIDLDSVPDMQVVRKELRGAPGEALALYQGRKDYQSGDKRCLISLLKPGVGPDGRMFPCCGVQYALKGSALDLDRRMDMGHYSEFGDRIGNQEPFDGSNCVQCYYAPYNRALSLLTLPVKHKRHV